MNGKKRVIVFGSTGSIGRATLSVIEEQKERFEVIGLSCRKNVKALNEQIEKFRPKCVCVLDTVKKKLVKKEGCKVFAGIEGIREMLQMEHDVVVNAVSGTSGLFPTIEALKFGRVLALANKESVVMAGRIIEESLRKYGARIIPIDSEHSALYQLLKKTKKREVKGLILTASGGPFKDLSREELKEVRPKDALKHPVWKMGKKITLDSATLMNKGLEVIEARWLFGFKGDQIKVLIHPESILHGLIELIDGSFLAYMAYPDMKIPISYALNEGERRPVNVPKLELDRILRMVFFPPDLERFPALRLAYEALKEGDSAQIVLNTSNEVASHAFLKNKIRFTEIPTIIEKVLEKHPRKHVINDIGSVLEIYEWTKTYTQELLSKVR
jgi:1-deoxy-D-xylulose-5-phosphate reductoisomerase